MNKFTSRIAILLASTIISGAALADDEFTNTGNTLVLRGHI